ncbi:flagellar hook-associated protein FlgL, partial [Burkholderia thailandensis]|nr:flagellar hook-associated protein FlgL [Burkholderia thailandensis]
MTCVLILPEPADDQREAEHAVKLSVTSATLSQYTQNQTIVQTALQSEDTTLTNVNDGLDARYPSVRHGGDRGSSDRDGAALGSPTHRPRARLHTATQPADGTGHRLLPRIQPSAQLRT